MRTEPAPSEPTAAATRPAATAAAAPPQEPPGVCSRFQGLRVAPKAGRLGEVPLADLGRVGLADEIAPAARSRRTISASRSARMLAAAAEGALWPAMSMSSLIAIGTPSSGAALAGAEAAVGLVGLRQRLSAQTTRKALRVAWDASICSRVGRPARERSTRRWPAGPPAGGGCPRLAGAIFFFFYFLRLH